jgi:hypothetical protein
LDIEIIAGFYFADEARRRGILTIVHDGDAGVFYLVGQGKTEQYDLCYRKSEEHEQGFPVSKDVEELFSDENK